MKFALWITGSCGLALALSGCGNQSGGGNGGYQQADTGPFDSRGNYVEEWADNPSQWKKGAGGRSTGSSRPGPPVTPVEDVPVIAKTEEPPMNSVPLPGPAVVSNPKPRPKISDTKTPPKETARSSSTADAKPKTSTKPKPVLVKKKSPPKAVTKRYTIRKGDSLSTIASRNGTTVGALQRANGIKGTLIQPGKSLVIPK